MTATASRGSGLEQAAPGGVPGSPVGVGAWRRSVQFVGEQRPSSVLVGVHRLVSRPGCEAARADGAGALPRPLGVVERVGVPPHRPGEVLPTFGLPRVRIAGAAARRPTPRVWATHRRSMSSRALAFTVSSRRPSTVCVAASASHTVVSSSRSCRSPGSHGALSSPVPARGRRRTRRIARLDPARRQGAIVVWTDGDGRRRRTPVLAFSPHPARPRGRRLKGMVTGVPTDLSAASARTWEYPASRQRVGVDVVDGP
jgi:hypothetical protein